jgi:teichuronic acid biosynthesis glycosyltransferase TuaC
MKILFIASNRKGKGLSPFIISQKESLEKYVEVIDTFLILGTGLINYFRSIRLLRSKCKHNHYDIIHAHYGFCGIVALMSFLKRPIVVSFMGDDLLGTPNSKGHYTFRSLFYTKINKLFSPLYTSVIVKSQELGLTLPNILFNVIPNGVDFEKFYPFDKMKARQRLGLTEKEIIIVFGSSAYIARKNFKLAKEAIEFLKTPDISLITLEDIPSQDVFFYFNAADLMLLTSFHEGSPNVIKEAMACNCPIVSTDVGDVREIIHNTKGCFICSYEPRDVADKINQAISFAIRTNGREMISHLELNQVSEKIIVLYKNILKI